MAHELFGERFFGHRQPAWHKLGVVMQERMSAVDAFRKIGEYSIRTSPCYAEVAGTMQTINRQAIIREKTAKGEAESVLGIVGPDFRPIGPLASCSIFDEAVNEAVETMGSLRDGAVLFITTKLPTFDVKGDEVEDYLCVVNPMDGGSAARILRTPVRIVCQNTLSMGERAGTIAYRVRHDENAQGNLHKWLGEAYGKAKAQAALVKEAMEVLANYRVSGAEAVELATSIYPDPTVPKKTAPREIMIRREEHREYVREHREVAREQVLALFGGKGTGMDTVAAKGTAWGFYNAAAEYEDCRWGKNPQEAVESAVFGQRADVKGLAFEKCCALAGVSGGAS